MVLGNAPYIQTDIATYVTPYIKSRSLAEPPVLSEKLKIANL